ncbi:hypothetical protein Tco_0072823 [Tanacetum coccineum]
MAEQQTIKYAPQWNNMTVENVTFHTYNVVGNFNYPPNVPAYKPIMKFMLNYPLRKAFTNCPSMVNQNLLKEFWSTVVAYDPFPSTNETKQRPLREFLIKFLVFNGQRPLTLDFNTFCSSTGLDYNNCKYVEHPTPEAVKKELDKISINLNYLDKTLVLGGNYSSLEQVNSIQQLLAYSLITGTEVDIGEIIYSDLVTKLLNKFLLGILRNSNFIKDPSKVNDIELTAHMIVVNSQKDSLSLLPLAAKPKKGKSQTVTPTLPKSQGPEIPGALSKKSKRPKSKRPPTKTKVSPPKPMNGSEQSHSVSSGTVPDPQDLERGIQLANMGLPSTLDEGTRKSKPLPESKPSHEWALDTQPIVLSTYADVGAFLLSDDKSEEDILRAGKEMDEEPLVAGIAKTQHQSLPLQEKHKEVVVNYADLKSSIDDYYDENIAHQDHTDKLVEASMSSLDKSSNTISDLYKGLNIITKLLKEIKNVVKDDSVINKKITDTTESFTKFSKNITDLQSSVNTLQAHALKQDEELAAWG